ncbi:hypothetical protein CVIRNUC_007339 [Coccomyxa viridis]|uniref:AAA+ ATPase domain-containing protein n=1 Tax=Coccomyxa viridis TaxID=1274662 RepID=A0AAV1IB95_9CHLO|nr:hypothetical protein CVIRNUC_007339 [Coccomyxa viridis]
MQTSGRCRLAATAAVEHLNDNGYQSDDSHQLLRHWQILAASSIIALSLPMGQASCEASRETLMEQSKGRIINEWDILDENLHRQEAAMPFSQFVSRAKPPAVTCSREQIIVRIPVRGGVDLAGIIADVASSFSRGCGADTVAKITEDDDQRTFHFECSSSTGPLGGLQAEIIASKRRSSAAEVIFRKDGPLTEDDISAMSSAMRTANTLIKPGQGFRRVEIFEGSMEDIQKGAEDMFRELQGAFSFGFGMFPELEDRMAHEMRRLFRPDASTPSREDGFALPPPAGGLRRPSSFDLAGDMEDMRGMADEHTEEEQRIALGQSPSDGGGGGYGSAEADKAAARLQQLGVTVSPPGRTGAIDWQSLAGYDEQKRQIEDTMLLALLHPEVYEEVAKGTRRFAADSPRPRAVLFEGPPGCGKTTSARVIASQAAVPLIYVPLEAVASKWYGESERNLAEIFRAAEQLGGAIIFLDEVDSLATQRSSEMHEATRRLLGVLLRQLDGFGPQSKSIVVGATNRRQDLDPALLSRFDAAVTFGLPSEANRQQIMQQYATHLAEEDIAELARATEGMSGRDLRDIAEQSERRTASKIVRSELPKGTLPGLAEYLEAAAKRRQEKKAAPVVPTMRNLMATAVH